LITSFFPILYLNKVPEESAAQKNYALTAMEIDRTPISGERVCFQKRYILLVTFLFIKKDKKN